MLGVHEWIGSKEDFYQFTLTGLKSGLGCNPIHIFLAVGSTEHNRIHLSVGMHWTALLDNHNHMDDTVELVKSLWIISE